jgi:xylulokinase
MSATKGKYIWAVDLGTSGPKVALVSTDGEVACHEFERTQLLLLPNGGAEQRPDDWWNAIKKATRRLLDKGIVPRDEIVAACLTTQWSGTVAVDRAGKPLMNAIIWMDSRGAPYVMEICDGLIKIEGYELRKLLMWLRLAGGVPAQSGKDSLGHILYIKHQMPGIYSKTYKFLEPKDYLNLRLTGCCATSYESMTPHWVTDNRSLSNVVYDDRLVRMSTIDGEKLPQLKRAIDVLGPILPDVAHELGLPEDVQVIMGTPDMQSAALGSGAVGDFEGHLYLGTSAWLMCHVPFKKTDLFGYIGSIPSAIPDRYLAANEQECAAACLTFLRDNILYHQDELLTDPGVRNVYQVFDRIAERVPAGSNRLLFTPWLYGERTPVDDHSIRGGFHNLSLQTTREHLIRAIFEGVAFNTRWLLKHVEKFIKRRLHTINVIGGGANSHIWCQIHADVLDRTIRQVKDPILANTRGAAFLASVALGYLTFDDIPERVQIANICEPNSENRSIYDELFDEFVNIYKHNRRMCARLNRGAE